MGKRSTSRRLAMQIIYQMEFSNISLEDACGAALSNVEYIDETKEFSCDLAAKTWEHKAELDQLIEKYSKGWKLERINVIDKSILRLALYELLYSKDLPKNIVIDEAVELAKKYSDPEASKFVN
ncbi:MAG: transcription antitermination factor NusB, partial [Candidatus Margulisiibacteriota bacterium]